MEPAAYRIGRYLARVAWRAAGFSVDATVRGARVHEAVKRTVGQLYHQGLAPSDLDGDDGLAVLDLVMSDALRVERDAHEDPHWVAVAVAARKDDTDPRARAWWDTHEAALHSLQEVMDTGEAVRDARRRTGRR